MDSEEVWYLTKSCPEFSDWIDVWSGRKDRRSKFALQFEKSYSEGAPQIDNNMMMIKTQCGSTTIGLFGTVTGRITASDVMAFTGGGDVKAMAGGVSKQLFQQWREW